MAKKKTASAKQGSSDTEAKPFEESLADLESIVSDLESGQLGLTESLTRYEAGVSLLKQCFQSLQKAERKIELLSGLDAEGRPITQEFDDADETLEQKAENRSKRRGVTTRKTKPSIDEESGGGVDASGRLF